MNGLVKCLSLTQFFAAVQKLKTRIFVSWKLKTSLLVICVMKTFCNDIHEGPYSDTVLAAVLKPIKVMDLALFSSFRKQDWLTLGKVLITSTPCGELLWDAEIILITFSPQKINPDSPDPNIIGVMF